jgi:hypothetical protein
VWRIIEFLIALAIGVGAVLVVAALLRDRLAQQASSEPLEAEVEDVNPPLDEWRQQGRPGWELIFGEACSGLPGYIVDVGRPARRALAEVGADARPMLVEKLSSGDFTERIVAIQVLGSIGEPPQQVAQLLERELRQASTRREEIGVLKCASTLPSCEPLIHVSLIALGSRHAATRRIAAEYLYLVRGERAAPRDLTQRFVALIDDPDPTIRFLYADRFSREGAPHSYQVLLDGLSSPSADTVLLAAYHVAHLRGVEHVVPGTNSREQLSKSLEAHRRWLRERLH